MNGQEQACARAWMALDRYRQRYGDPPQAVLDGLPARLADLAAPNSQSDWRDLLDRAFSEVGYAIEWQGEAVYRITGPR